MLIIIMAYVTIFNKSKMLFCVFFAMFKYSSTIIQDKGIRFIVLYPPKDSHDLFSLAGLYTQKPFQSPEGYSRVINS